MHTGNVAFMIPSLDHLLEEEVMKEMGVPETGPVSRIDGKDLTPQLPEYLVWPIYFPVNVADLCGVKIIDYGESFHHGDRPQTLHTPLAVLAPEVMFEDDRDRRVDLWSLGCMVTYS